MGSPGGPDSRASAYRRGFGSPAFLTKCRTILSPAPLRFPLRWNMPMEAQASRCKAPSRLRMPTQRIYSPWRVEFDNEWKGNFLTWAELGLRKG